MAWPTSVATNADLYLAVNNLSTVLNGAIGAGDTTINVSNASSFPTTGILTIDLEAIHYTGTTPTSFTGCTRGFDGTTGASHANSATVFHDIPAAHHNVLKDEIIAVETYLDGTLNKTGDGTAALPSYSFENATGSGMSWSSAGATSLQFSHLGSLRLAFDTTNGWVISNARGIESVDGTSAAPSYSFSADSNTGMYRISADRLGLSAGGTVVFDATNTRVELNNVPLWIQDGSAGAPGLAWPTDTNTGLYRSAADTFNLVTNGVARATVTTTGFNTTVPIDVGSNKITSLAAGTASGDALHFGQTQKIKQVVEGATTTYTSSTSSSYVDTTLSATITPTSTSSKILVIVSQSFFRAADGTTLCALNRSDVGTIAEYMAFFENNGGTGGAGAQTGLTHLDSPATTSARTYKTQMRNRVGTGLHWANGDGSATTTNRITLIELEP